MASDPLAQTRRSIPDLLNGRCVHGHIDFFDNGSDDYRAASECDECIQVVLDELTARDAEIARLRAVLEWVVDRSPTHAWQGQLAGCALHGNWPAVRAAGVALPEEE